MPSKLYVGNLAYSVSNSDLEELFSQAGQVQSVAVITDKFSGRNIKVSEAKPRESSFGGGGGGNRRGGGDNRGGGGGGRW
jgi:cold-inducible RNA-binding protein